MFAGFMVNAWAEATIVAVVAGVVGFFVVLRGSAFVAHALPNGAFAGAAGANLIGINTIVGLGAFSLLGALGIGVLGRRGRHDAVTALALVFMLGLGALFLQLSHEFASVVEQLLFGEVLGVSDTELVPTAALAVACAVAVAIIYRPLMLSSLLPEAGEARGVSRFGIELCFLVVVALATTMTVPVVGTLLIFSLMIGAPAAARSLTDRPGRAMALSVAIALVTVWLAIAMSYATNYPVGFFVGTAGALWYAIGRAWAARRRRSGRRPESARPAPALPSEVPWTRPDPAPSGPDAA